ncbi:MAG: hypothetical protein ACRDRJ_00360 [Streptosporangiaceae bacterium]
MTTTDYGKYVIVVNGDWTYRYLAEAIAEREALVPREMAALINAEAKLAVLGPRLPYPHSSAVQGADRLRKLRPRGGRSPWRALYRQVGDEFVLAAVAPEAQVDPRGFVAGCRRAEARLADFEETQG